MSKHTTHKIRRNSQMAYAELDKATRANAVFSMYLKHGALTDREVRDYLRLQEMNAVRPAITTLIDEGRLVECGHTKCVMTNRTVRLCCVANGTPVQKKPRTRTAIMQEQINEAREIIENMTELGHVTMHNGERARRWLKDTQGDNT